MAKHSINEFDVFYISYDEPKKEENWAKLQDICPWAQRVDGVKGFDNAHKACANASTTDRFITVDGDNQVYPEFFDLELEIPDSMEDKVLSWGARNVVNGLHYGNGGLKLWTKEFVLNMRTHENADTDAEKLDFCWDDKYVQLNNTYSDTCVNGSPFQAFRAGFREGVKMTLDRGTRVTDGLIKNHIYQTNFKRLLIWASIGADVEHGEWAILGTRMGIYQANISFFDMEKISDYDWFKNYFETDIMRTVEMETLAGFSRLLLVELQRILGLNIADMNAEQSKFFKEVYEAPKRNTNATLTEVEATRVN